MYPIIDLRALPIITQYDEYDRIRTRSEKSPDAVKCRFLATCSTQSLEYSRINNKLPYYLAS